MRTIPAAAQTKLDTNCGTEPIIIVEIQWVEGGGTLRSPQAGLNRAFPVAEIVTLFLDIGKMGKDNGNTVTLFFKSVTTLPRRKR